MRIAAFMRHAEPHAPPAGRSTDDDRDRGLTESGRRQALAARDWLQGLDPVTVLCSDSPPAVQTAEIVGAPLAPRIVSGPAESRLDAGELLARASAALQEALPSEGNVLIVGERSTNAVLIGDALGLAPAAARSIPQDHAGVSLMSLEDSRDQVLALNVTPLNPLRLGRGAAADALSTGATQQRLFIIRHAETQTVTDDGRLQSGGDVALTARGREMARALGTFFSPLGLTRVHTSDQLRARQTGRGVGGEAATVIAHAGLREIALGDADGRDALTAFAAVPSFLRDPDVGMAGGETPREVRRRAGTEVAGILSDEAAAPAVAIVGHGCLNRMLLSHLLELDIVRALRIRQDWTGVSVLARRAGGWRVGALNWNPGGMREFSLTRRVDGVAPEVWQRLGR